MSATLSFVSGMIASPAGPDAHEWWPDGALVYNRAGRILALGARPQVAAQFPGLSLEPAPQALILPGFVDAHLHLPQHRASGGMGYELLPWLKNCAFPEEMRFARQAYAEEVAGELVRDLLGCGVTAAAVFGSVHGHSAEALFAAARPTGLRLVAGKVAMDREAPEELCQPAAEDGPLQEALIQRWHGAEGGRFRYALTPRFAVSCSAELLRQCGELAAGGEGLFVHTHISENRGEIEAVAEQYPNCEDYLAVYERFGLVGPRTLLAHGIHLTPRERRAIASAGATVVHCPSSNLFLGSGTFGVRAAWKEGLRVALGSDIAGGNSLNPWRVLDDAYKTSALVGAPLNAGQLLYLATQAGAEALGGGSGAGQLRKGGEATFQVLNLAPGRRTRPLATLPDVMELGLADERALTLRQLVIAGAPQPL